MAGMLLSKQARKQQLAAARKEKDKKWKQFKQMGMTIVEWDEMIDSLETALEPFKHKKGKSRTLEQNVMAMETVLHVMKTALEDAKADDTKAYLDPNVIDKEVGHIHSMGYHAVKAVCRMLIEEKNLIVA
mmetsp:Transcript_27265/g.34815  ORF Transcript_27265/g.34815 Transcript_27265/m.34815 type:complete len:130 (-) Transcript_27265:523-912(-)